MGSFGGLEPVSGWLFCVLVLFPREKVWGALSVGWYSKAVEPHPGEVGETNPRRKEEGKGEMQSEVERKERKEPVPRWKKAQQRQCLLLLGLNRTASDAMDRMAITEEARCTSWRVKRKGAS